MFSFLPFKSKAFISLLSLAIDKRILQREISIDQTISKEEFYDTRSSSPRRERKLLRLRIC